MFFVCFFLFFCCCLVVVVWLYFLGLFSFVFVKKNEKENED